MCFSCRQERHKSHQCPNNKKDKVKKVTEAAHKVETLDDMDVMGTVNGYLLHITIDSGVKISLFLEEFVDPSHIDGTTL